MAEIQRIVAPASRVVVFIPVARVGNEVDLAAHVLGGRGRPDAGKAEHEREQQRRRSFPEICFHVCLLFIKKGHTNRCVPQVDFC